MRRRGTSTPCERYRHAPLHISCRYGIGGQTTWEYGPHRAHRVRLVPCRQLAMLGPQKRGQQRRVALAHCADVGHAARVRDLCEAIGEAAIEVPHCGLAVGAEADGELDVVAVRVLRRRAHDALQRSNALLYCCRAARRAAESHSGRRRTVHEPTEVLNARRRTRDHAAQTAPTLVLRMCAAAASTSHICTSCACRHTCLQHKLGAAHQ